MGEELQTITEEEFWRELRKQLLQDDKPAVKQQALRLAAELRGWTKGSAKDKEYASGALPRPLQEVAKKLRRKPIPQDKPDKFGLLTGTQRMDKEKNGTAQESGVESTPGPVNPIDTHGPGQDS